MKIVDFNLRTGLSSIAMSQLPGSHKIIGMEEEDVDLDQGRSNFIIHGSKSSGLDVVVDGFRDAKEKNSFITFPQADLFLVELPMD